MSILCCLKDARNWCRLWLSNICLPFPFLASAAPNRFEAMLLRTLRGVDGVLPPKMSLVPPPGGRSTLQINEKKMKNIETIEKPSFNVFEHLKCAHS